MLLKSGGLKKPDIGAIKTTETQTFIQLDSGSVDGFIDTIGPQGKIEQAITATRLDGQPDYRTPGHTSEKGRGSDRSDRKPYASKGKRDFGRKDKPARSNKSPREETLSRDDKPKAKSFYEEGSFKRKPRSNSDGGSQPMNRSQSSGDDKPKKPHKKKIARAAALNAKPGGVKKGERKNTRKKDRR